MEDFGSVIETDEITISNSGAATVANGGESVTLPDSHIEDSLDVESFGEVILDCEIRTHRKRRPVRLTVGFTDQDIYRIRQKRAEQGRKFGEEYEFDLTPHQRATLDKWNEIIAQEDQADKEAFERRMKRNQQTYGKVG
jgi:hypothetical protein